MAISPIGAIVACKVLETGSVTPAAQAMRERLLAAGFAAGNLIKCCTISGAKWVIFVAHFLGRPAAQRLNSRHHRFAFQLGPVRNAMSRPAYWPHERCNIGERSIQGLKKENRFTESKVWTLSRRIPSDSVQWNRNSHAKPWERETSHQFDTFAADPHLTLAGEAVNLLVVPFVVSCDVSRFRLMIQIV